MFWLFKNNLLWSEGLPILILLGVLTFFSLFFFKPFIYVILAVFIFSVYFFRNPERISTEVLDDMSVLICPADGKIIEVNCDKSNDFEGYSQKVSIFLSAFDVHVNWIPMSGVIKKVLYKPGKFHVAFLPKSSELNERNDVEITNQNGVSIIVRQIAGIVARRICCWVSKGEVVRAGQKFGMIRFGSRIDIFLPKNVSLNVGVGQRVYGGQTVLGRFIWQ